MASYKTITVETGDGLCVLTQNRPERLNARSSQMYAEMIAAFEEAHEDDSVAALLLASNGSAFCAGMDFRNDFTQANTFLPEDGDRVRAVKSEFVELEIAQAAIELARRFVASFIKFEKPLIGAINGAAVGEGFSSVLHCDVLYARPQAYFWAPFARAGAAPEFCYTILAQERLGASLANASLYLSRRITAEEALRVGFVAEIIDSDDFLAEVRKRVIEGLSLVGPPDLRASTLKRFKSLARDTSERERLLAQANREFALAWERSSSGETARVQAHFASELPGRRSAPEQDS